MEIDRHKINALALSFQQEAGGLISALRAIQAAYRCIPVDADAIVADIFNVSRAEVRGVISFYEDFSRTPKSRSVVRVCAAEACQAVGGRGLVSALEQMLGIKTGETDAANEVTLEPVYCLGLCSCAPAAMVDERLLARADAQKVKAALGQSAKEHQT